MLNDTMKNEAPDTIAPVFLMDLGADLSPALQALEAAYRMIQKAYPDTPDATIVVKRDARTWGHITVAKTWAAPGEEAADRYEIMVSGENLRRGAEAVAGTLIHEAAHVRNLAADVRDCDVNGRHNRKFKARAEEMGLTVEEHRTLGWTLTDLSEDGRRQWRALVRRVEKGLARSASAPDPLAGILTGLTPPPSGPTTGPAPVKAPPKRTGNRNLLKAVCGCGHSVRLSRTVLELSRPTCQVCEQEFEVQESDAA